MKADSKIRDCFHGAVVKAEKEAKKAAMANPVTKPIPASSFTGEELTAAALEIGPPSLNAGSIGSDNVDKVAARNATLGSDSKAFLVPNFQTKLTSLAGAGKEETSDTSSMLASSLGSDNADPSNPNLIIPKLHTYPFGPHPVKAGIKISTDEQVAEVWGKPQQFGTFVPCFIRLSLIV